MDLATDDDAPALDFLFNLTADPSESHDLRSSMPRAFEYMMQVPLTLAASHLSQPASSANRPARPNCRVIFCFRHQSQQQEFSRAQSSMIPDAFCGAADNSAANAVDGATQFIGPWIADPYFKCPGFEKTEEAVAHYNSILCLYNLLPRRQC